MKWIGDDGGIECGLGNGELCPFACEGDYCAPHPLLPPPPAPPQHPEIKTDKNISSHFRTSTSLTLISLPWAFSFENALPLPTPSSSFLSCLLLHLFFICLSPVHTRRPGEVCLEGVMCAESDPGDRQPPGSGHPLAGANGFIPARR